MRASQISDGCLDSSAIERDNESSEMMSSIGDDKMPQQEVFFEQATGDRRIQVLKTYDPAYAREVFDEMDEHAHAILSDTSPVSLDKHQAADSQKA